MRESDRENGRNRVNAGIGRLILCLALSLPVSVSANAESVRFAVIGDTQGDPVNTWTFPTVINQILEADPPVDLVIIVGDLVWGTDQGTEAMRDQFNRWLEIAGPLYAGGTDTPEVYVIPGNHDIHGRGDYAELWQEIFSDMPDNGPSQEKYMSYSFDAGPCHFLMLNTEWPESGKIADLEWVRSDLARTDQPVILAFGHRPAFPFSRHIGESLDVDPQSRDELWELFSNSGTSAYICGHEHYYDHRVCHGVHQITTAGLPGNFDLKHDYLIVDVNQTDVTVSVHWYTGRLLDEYTLGETENLNCEATAASGSPLLKQLPCMYLFLIVPAFLFTGFFGLACVEKGKKR